MTTGRWLRNGLDIKLFHAIYRECPECGGIKQPVVIAHRIGCWLNETAKRTATPPVDPVVVGIDGGYVRSRHRQEALATIELSELSIRAGRPNR
jgi:hypothetical protein